MVGVLKVENIDYHASTSDVRRLFKDYDARPEDIHMTPGTNWKHGGSAFVIFQELKEADNGLRVNGVMLRDKKLIVRPSNPREFNNFFPGVSMITNQKGMPRGRGGFSGRGRGQHNEVGSKRQQERQSFGIGRGSISSRNGIVRGGIQRNNSFRDDQREQRIEKNGRRDRSRSPLRNDRDNERDSFLKNFAFDNRSSNNRGRKSRVSPQRREIHKNAGNPSQFNNPLDTINERKFVKVSGLPFDITEIAISDFFRPILTRDIFFFRNVGGRFAGKPNGSAIVEFFTENDGRQALKNDGRKCGSRRAVIVPAERNEILRAVEGNNINGPPGGGQHVSGPMVPDISTLNAVANAHPQVQNLLTLLTATVNSLAGAAGMSAQQPQQHPLPGINDRSYRSRRSDRQRDDPVISRVANSANIDVNDIKMGKVVGIRNLPFSVTADEILDFFRGYHAIADSVRIHYLEDGRCSGDAIICFRGNREARNAVSTLNKRSIGRRKVELFFL
ncbi:uncharacterized protein LOC130614869 [Hydractinia symbiolongicarpus]|uniref:uncharacterized protein LOC130614869 n=1 Tax=Hydractinia symbiolongicarpus TaxID=13093 RepID=UPI00254F3BFF|nr:uncharacterized protein LOC130614869 [Hydractinia symbiolongicarpus]XP_057292318.1 uncharacterized protein LOC130614869 [Hydractinia symbiolongicarpus]